MHDRCLNRNGKAEVVLCYQFELAPRVTVIKLHYSSTNSYFKR